MKFIFKVDGEGIDPTRVKELIEKDGYKVIDVVEAASEKNGFFSSLFSKK